MKSVICALCIFSLYGCISAPDVHPIPERLQELNLPESDLREETSSWWLRLGDENLNKLIETGLSGSPSPQIALARLAQAEAEMAIAKSTRWPSLIGNGNRETRNFKGSDPDTRTDLGALNLTWDAGLWGKRRLVIEAAQQFRTQRWFELQAVKLSLSAAIAETYYQIVAQRSQSSLLDAQLRVSRDLERLIDARFRLGQARANELYQQREQSAALETLKLANDTQLEILERSLDTLLGEAPDTSPRVTRASLPTTPEAFGGTTPADLIRYRADIRAAYAQLSQAAASAGLRFAERLPSLQVSASLSSLADKALSTDWISHGLDLTAPYLREGVCAVWSYRLSMCWKKSVNGTSRRGWRHWRKSTRFPGNTSNNTKSSPHSPPDVTTLNKHSMPPATVMSSVTRTTSTYLLRCADCRKRIGN